MYVFLTLSNCALEATEVIKTAPRCHFRHCTSLLDSQPHEFDLIQLECHCNFASDAGVLPEANKGH